MGPNILFGFLSLVALISTDTILAENAHQESHELEIKTLPDDDFARLLSLLTQLLVSTRTDIQSLQNTVKVVQETMDDLKTRVENLEQAGSQLKETVVETQNQLSTLSLGLSSLKSAAVTNLRLGDYESTTVYRETGYVDVYGYVITGVENWNKDPYINYLYRRRIQIHRNGQWQNL